MLSLLMQWFNFWLILTLVLTLVWSDSPLTATPIEQTDSKALQHLIQNWLGLSELQLIPGKLPQHLPISLPLPQKAQVLGSIILSSNSFQIIVDLPQEPEQVKAFYRQQLSTAGWLEQKPGHSSLGEIGFLDPHQNWNTNQALEFCSLSDLAKLKIEVSSRYRPSKQWYSQLRLFLEVFSSTDSYDLSCLSSDNSSDVVKPLLPPLTPPSKVMIHSQFTVTSEHSSYSYAILGSEDDAQALVAHYAAQVEQLGWKLRTQGNNEQGIWSSWILPDHQELPTEGLLSITKLLGTSNEYIAYLLVQKKQQPEAQLKRRSSTPVQGR